MTDAISEGATERLEEYCREAEKRRDGKIGGASDLLHEMSGLHQRLYVSDLRAILDAKEAAEAGAAALMEKLEVAREGLEWAKHHFEQDGKVSFRVNDALDALTQPKEGDSDDG